MAPKAAQPEERADLPDKRRAHRRRARRRMWMRLTALVALCAMLFLLWQNWEVLSPNRLMENLHDLMGSGIGSYPVDISGSGVQQITRSKDYTVVLSDSYLTYLDSSGAEANRYPCTYPSALLSQAGKYVLLAELGGQRVQLNTRTATWVQMQTQQDILAVSVNEKGQFAVLTQGPQGYAVQVKVYDKQGKELYSRSRNQMAAQVALSADGTQVALLSVEAVNGQLNSSIDVFSLKSAGQDTLCSYQVKDSLLYQLTYLTDNQLGAIGENGTVMLHTTDGKAVEHTADGMRILGYACAGDTLALALRPYGSTAGGEVQMVSSSGETLCTVPFEGEFRDLSGQKGACALLTDSRVIKIDTAGQTAGADVPADGQQAVLDGNQAVVLGMNVLTTYKLS